MIDLREEDPLRALSDGLVGQVLPGSGGHWYPLRSLLGEGGQGWVYRATWNGGVDVVVKVLRPDTTSKEALARFQREAQVLRMLSQQPSPNPHVVRFLDHAYATVEVAATGASWNVAFTVLELVNGDTLEKALEKAQPAGIGLERARRILRQIVLALNDVHAHGIVHRDLKPSNILLDTSGGREIAKVTDFGLAKLLDPGMQRTTHLAGATVGYAPPEQFENGNLRVGRHTDVFSLAAIFYELVCGRPAFPFNENDHPLMVVLRILNEARPAFARVIERLPRELAERPDVIAALDAELARALSASTTERHATVAELYEGIERALGTLASPPSIGTRDSNSDIVVRANPAPASPSPADLIAMGKTLPVDESGNYPAPTTARMVPVERASNRDVSRPDPGGWRRLTAPVQPDAMLAISVAAAGDRAVAVGPLGAARWERGAWTRVDLPGSFDPRAMRAAAWLDDAMLFAGASPVVVARLATGAVVTWRFDLPGIVFHGAYADAAGVILAGERATPSGPAGIVAEIPRGASGAQPTRLIDVPGSGPLRAATRFGAGILACGDGGVVARAAQGGAPGLARICPPPLFALAALPDGTAVTVGGGGFVFRVWPGLEVQLDAIQTTRDLFAITRAADGALFCGGAGGRVLRRDAGGWIRIGGSDGDGRVRALHAAGSRLLAFRDDGSVVETVVA